MADRTRLYWFNWPSHVGGADTKFVHLVRLLADEYDITAVPNGPQYLEQTAWRSYLDSHGVKVALLEELPQRIDGWAVSLCNKAFLRKENGQAAEMKRRGARIAWSNEMMWHFPGELEAVRRGLVDRIMYVSVEQRRLLEPAYREATGASPAREISGEWWGEFPRRQAPPLPWVIAGNWMDPAAFPFRERGDCTGGPFVIGRLSRPDPDKFPDDFPRFYENLALRRPVRFRVMGWSDQLRERWSEHVFDARWELLETACEPVTEFLNALDLFVYELSPRFRESWGRAVVEAMLCGAVPVVPAEGGHHLDQLVTDGVSGFLCRSRAEFGLRARQLQDDPGLLRRLSRGAREDACMRHCNPASHLEQWRRVFAE